MDSMAPMADSFACIPRWQTYAHLSVDFKFSKELLSSHIIFLRQLIDLAQLRIIMDFIEIKKHKELVEAYEVIKELIPELDKGDFLKSVNHELLKNHKLFGLKSSGNLFP